MGKNGLTVTNVTEEFGTKVPDFSDTLFKN